MSILLSIQTVLLNTGAFTAVATEGADGFGFGTKLIISLVIGLIVGFIYAMVLKGQLTSVYKNDSAADYTRDNSFVVSDKKDIFMYSKTEKTAKPQQSSN